jgi:hypothetical protein
MGWSGGGTGGGGSGDGTITSVNGDAGPDVVLDAGDVGAQPSDADLSAIAALTTTSFGRGLLTSADAAGLRTSAGLGTAATHATTDYDASGAAAAAQTAAIAASTPLDISSLPAVLASAINSSDPFLLRHGSVPSKMVASELLTYLHQGIFGRPGTLNIDGDSRTQLGPGGAVSANAGYPSGNWTHVLAALFGVAPTEIHHRGASGSRACTANRTTILRQGTGVVAKHALPPHFQMASLSSSFAAAKAAPGLTVIMYGLNAFGSDTSRTNNATAFGQCETAEIHGHRFIVWRARVARLFVATDAAAAYAQGSGGSNGWSTVAKDYATAGTTKATACGR